MKDINDAFPFLPENNQTCNSADMLKNKEEELKFQETHFRSAMYTLQKEKINDYNRVWCIQYSKDEAESMKYKGFIPPRSAIVHNNEYVFEGNRALVIDIDLQELRHPSKFKKLGSNPNSSNIKRKN